MFIVSYYTDYLTLRPPLTYLVINLKKLTTTGIAIVATKITGNQLPRVVVRADACASSQVWKPVDTAIPPSGIRSNK